MFRKHVLLERCCYFSTGTIAEGVCNQVLASRENLGCVTVTSETRDKLGEYEWKLVLGKAVIIESAMTPDDFVLIESKHHQGKLFPKTTWQLLAGKSPQWMNFPLRWFEWTQNPEVYRSAVNHIIVKRYWMFDLIYQAGFGIQSLDSFYARWGDILFLTLKQQRAVMIWEKISRQVRTPSNACGIPIRIAKALGGWIPPVAEPVFGRPDLSALRVLRPVEVTGIRLPEGW